MIQRQPQNLGAAGVPTVGREQRDLQVNDGVGPTAATARREQQDLQGINASIPNRQQQIPRPARLNVPTFDTLRPQQRGPQQIDGRALGTLAPRSQQQIPRPNAGLNVPTAATLRQQQQRQQSTQVLVPTAPTPSHQQQRPQPNDVPEPTASTPRAQPRNPQRIDVRTLNSRTQEALQNQMSLDVNVPSVREGATT